MLARWKNTISKGRAICARKRLAAVTLTVGIICAGFVWQIPVQALYSAEQQLYFADLPHTHWAYTLASELAGYGAYPETLLVNGRFQPDSPLSRSEALLLIYNGIGLPVMRHHDTDNDGVSDANEFKIGTDPTREDTDRDSYDDWHEITSGYDPNNRRSLKKLTANIFTDVKFDDWKHDLIYEAYSAELINGYADQTFRPDASISRIEFIKVAISAAGLRLLPPDRLSYQDVPFGHWSLPYLATAMRYGLINGDQIEFKPDKPISRVEASKIVYKLKEL